MYPQFDYGSLYGGNFNPYGGFGFGGFNPYQGFGAYNPYQYNMGGLFGGGSPYDDLFSSFQTKLDDLFKNYQNKITAPAENNAAPITGTTGQTTDTTKTDTAKKEPYQFKENFGTGALSGKGFSQGGINQLKEAGIVSNKQQANEMLKSFQGANAGKNVTQQQFIDYANQYKPPAQTYTMPGGTTTQKAPNIKPNTQYKQGLSGR